MLYLYDPLEIDKVMTRAQKLTAKKQWEKLDKVLWKSDDKDFAEVNRMCIKAFRKLREDLANATGLPEGPSTFEMMLSWEGQVTSIILTWLFDSPLRDLRPLINLVMQEWQVWHQDGCGEHLLTGVVHLHDDSHSTLFAPNEGTS